MREKEKQAFFFRLPGFWAALFFLFPLFLNAESNQDKILYDSLKTCARSNLPQALRLGFHLMDIKRENMSDTIYAHTPIEIGYILDKQGFPMQALGFFSIAIERLKEVNRFHYSGYLHIDIGNIYFYQNDFEKAREKYLQAQALFQDEGNQDGIYTAINNLGLIESAMERPRLALAHFRRALKLARNRSEHPYLLAHSYQYISGIYFSLGMQDSLVAYQDSALAVYIPQNGNNLKGLIHQKAAEIYLARGDTTAALNNIRQAVKHFRQPLDIYKLADLYEMKAEILSDFVNRDSMLFLLQEAEEFCRTNNMTNHHLRFLQQRIALLSKFGENQPLAEAANEYILLVNEKEDTANRLQVERLDILSMLAQYQNTLELNRLNLRNARNIRNAAILIGLLLLALLILLIIRYQYKKRMHRQILAQKELLMQSELALHQKQIEAQESKLAIDTLQREKIERELLWKTTLLQQQNAFLKELKRDFRPDLSEKKSEDSELLKVIIKDIENNIHNPGTWDDFEKQFVKVYPGFFEKLCAIRPDLTQKEKKICAYHRMNLDTKEIAALCSISTRTVESSRYRLKKKLGIAQENNFQEFINTI